MEVTPEISNPQSGNVSKYKDKLRHGHYKGSGIAQKKVVWNLSGIHIPPETEELLGRLGMNFRFAPKKFPALEIVQSTELICQRIEKYETTDQCL